MPCFRGVGIFIGSESDFKRLPEFPHPDSSSVNLLLPPHDLAHQPRNTRPMATFSTEPDLRKMPKAIPRVNPSISVYVPSVPGTKFWLHYSVSRITKPPCQLYFKMFLNGRNVTNWGVNPATTTSGTVAKALFEPDRRWQCRDENGIMVKLDGIEARFFQFASTDDTSQAGIDRVDRGGVIEVQVFRAKGKRRRAPRLGEHGNQERFGISTPSAGLIDHPEHAAYFDWLLMDPKDAPYACFRFHYRPWSTLKRHNIVPPAEASDRAWIGSVLPPLPTISDVETRAQLEPGRLGEHGGGDCRRRENKADPAQKSAIRDPPEVFSVRGGGISPVAQPSKMARDGYLNARLNRPLPPLPLQRRPAPEISRKPVPDPVTGPSLGPPSHNGAVDDQPQVDGHVKYGIGTQVSLRMGTGCRPVKAALVDIPRSQTHGSTLYSKESMANGNATVMSDKRNTAIEFLELTEAEWLKPSPPRGRLAATITAPASPEGGRGKQANGEGRPTLPRIQPTRGLLGTDLSRIPLTGPSGDLMRKLRKEDPFKRT